MQQSQGSRPADDAQGYVAPALPREIEVGGEPMVLRRVSPADADRMHAFFLALPASDLLLLRRDVTDGREIDNWMREIERGETVTLIAESEGTVMGETTLHLTGVPWSRHVGILRVFTAREQRGRGLGRVLTEEIMRLAPSLGIEKLVAEMTVEQVAAQKLIEQLGFREEARLTNYVKDRNHRPHDLMIMTRDLGSPSRRQQSEHDGQSAVWHCTACGVVTHSADPPNRCADCGAGPGFLLRADEDA
jgi:RimJ/RimL family protein N-acetyltransferase